MKYFRLTYIVAISFLLFSCSCFQTSRDEAEEEAFLEDLKEHTFQYFWDRVDKHTLQVDDRYPTPRFTSIAATGFGLTSVVIGIENDLITRETGAERVCSTLEWLWRSEQSDSAQGAAGFRGFYYHFLTYEEGKRYKKVELSTVDTGLLIAGILSCQSYFEEDNETEKGIRELADSLYLRVEWDWAMNGRPWMSMGWHPETGFLDAVWDGYNEAMILLILAMGSPTHPIPGSAWKAWCSTYEWQDFYGYEYVNFSPMFGHQYSHMYIDFRDIQDEYMKNKGIDYFENSRRATLANRAYCIKNPGGFMDYGEFVWGLTACDGPGPAIQEVNGDPVRFYAYGARGASAIRTMDDGTIAPTAAGGSIPFAPDICINALQTMKNRYGDNLYQEYGFKDAFNMTFIGEDGNRGWFDPDYLGIDQGPIIIQLENYQSGLIWELMKHNRYIVNGLKRAGFSGGWLDKIN